jgi:sec-independent protein translocase protein TatC
MASAIDESTLRTIDSGRAALGDIISAAQSQLQKVFIVFLIGFLGSFYVFRTWVLPAIKDQLLIQGVDVHALTAFDVILLQTKVGLICGVIIAVPAMLYVGRDALRARGWYPSSPIPRWQIVILGLLVTVLFIGGVLYAYYLFFPLLFDFLVKNTIQSGIKPHYSIVKWVHFIAILSLAMGLSAELPLVMTVLSYAEIVSYETFRSKWRHAFVGMFVIASIINGSPDPFSMSLVAVPLIVLYIIGLGISKFVVTVKYSSERVGIIQIILSHWISIIGSAVVSGLLAYGILARWAPRSFANYYIRRLSTRIGYNLPTLPSAEWIFALQHRPTLAMIAFGVTVGLIVGVTALIIQLFRTVDAMAASGSSSASAGGPSDIDFSRLDADAIAAVPVEAFEAMSEDEALEHASTAMDAGNNAKAQAILDRFDTIQESTNPAPVEAGATAAAANDVQDEGMGTPETQGQAPNPNAQDDTDAGDVVTQTTTGMLNAFTDDEQSEDDIGGYFYDIQFILGSLTSKMFRIIGIFMLVMGVTFAVLYRGGLKILKEDFLSRLPAEARSEVVDIVALHPVEALVFDMKLSVVLAAAITLPIILYYMWPAMNESGTIRSGHGLLFTWTVSSFIALAAGSVLGYTTVAPYVISWLAYDVLQAGMLIKYQISAAGWLVFFTTVGVGLLAIIPVAQYFLHRAGLIPFTILWGHWREALSVIFVVISLAAPKGVFGMFLFSLPVVAAYLIGLIFLWFYTFGGRRVGPLKKSRSVNS